MFSASRMRIMVKKDKKGFIKTDYIPETITRLEQKK